MWDSYSLLINFRLLWLLLLLLVLLSRRFVALAHLIEQLSGSAQLFLSEGFMLVSNLHTETNHCPLLHLTFEHDASAEGLRELLRRSEANPDATLLEDTHFAVVEGAEQTLEGIDWNSISTVDYLRDYVAPLAILLGIWNRALLAGEETRPTLRILVLLFFLSLSESLRVLITFVAYDFIVWEAHGG